MFNNFLRNANKKAGHIKDFFLQRLGRLSPAKIRLFQYPFHEEVGAFTG